MLKRSSLYLFFILLTFSSDCIYSQVNLDNLRKFDIGIDFLHYNKNWISYNDILIPKNGRFFDLSLIPSPYFIFNNKKYSYRLKYEYANQNYWFIPDGFDYFDEINGVYKNGRILMGIQKNLINKRIIFYPFLDFGISKFTFSGIHISSNPITWIRTELPFYIKGGGFSLQTGFGSRYTIYKNLFINMETAYFIEKTIQSGQPIFLIQNPKFIPRPLNLVGIGYAF